MGFIFQKQLKVQGEIVEDNIPSAVGGDAGRAPLRKPAMRRNRSDGNASSYSSKNDVKVKKLDEFATTGTIPDYKDYERLRRFVNQQGKIMPRRRTGLTAKNQRLLASAIKRARHLALLPMPGAPRP